MAERKQAKQKPTNGLAAGTAVWQPVVAGAGGDWSQAAHWVGGTVGAAGLVVDIGPAGLLAAGNFVITATNEAALDLNIQLYQGTLVPKGTLQVGNTLAITGGTLLVDAAVLDTAVGTVDLNDSAFTHGVVLLRDGGTWNTGSLEIGEGAAGNVALSSGTAGTGGTLDVSGVLDLGSDAQAFAGGTLTVAGGSRVAAATLDLLAQSVLSLDAASMVSIGTSLTIAGAVLVGAGATLDGAGGTIEGNVVDDGTLLANSPLPGAVLVGPVITGTLSGDGSVPVEYEFTVGNAASFTGTISLDPGAELLVGSGGVPQASISMQNATIDLQGIGVTAPVYTPSNGRLTVGGTTLNVDPGLSQYDFTTTSDGTGGVLVIEHPYDSWVAVGATGDGTWTDAAHWLTGAVPVADTTVEIGDSLSVGDFTVTVNSASAAAEDLAMDVGGLVVSGSLAVGNNLDMNGGDGVTVADGGSLSAGFLFGLNALVQVDHGVLTTTSADIEYGVIVQDGGVWNVGNSLEAPSADLFLQNGSTDRGGTLDVTGSLALGLGALSATGGSVSRIGTLALDYQGQVTVDSTSAIAVGGAATSAGAVAIGVAGTLSAENDTSIQGNVVDNGVLSVFEFASPGSLQVQGTLGGSGLVDVSNSTLEVSGASGFSGTITVDQSVLTLDAGGLPHALLQMAGGGTVDLRGQAPATPVYNGTTGLLKVGATTLDVGQGLAAVDFSAVTDHNGGTLVTQTGTVPCYVAGTRIATASGDVPVEALRPGDHVRTAGGRLAPVVWVGRARIDLLRHPAPRAAAPIRIEAGAIGPGLPRRDLLVSPDHALAVDGYLVPARLLANGASIASVTDFASVTYIHVELDRHDLMLAEGVAAESFLDTGNRGTFSQGSGVRKLFPDFSATAADSVRIFAECGCAPLLLAGPVVQAEHARLVARAAALGHRQTGDADLRIEADHPATEAVARPDGVALKLLAAIHRLRLRSRSFVPAELDPARPDGRQLGVMLALRLDGDILPEPAFAFGWHASEDGGDWRWTDGDAALVLELNRPAELTVRLRPVGARYWLERPITEAGTGGPFSPRLQNASP